LFALSKFLLLRGIQKSHQYLGICRILRQENDKNLITRKEAFLTRTLSQKIFEFILKQKGECLENGELQPYVGGLHIKFVDDSERFEK